MSESLANLGLPLLAPSQAQKHLSHNEALQVLDAVVQLVVRDRTRTSPPASPEDGHCHIVAAGADGSWSGQDQNLAHYNNGTWHFLAPRLGWHGYDIAAAERVEFDGSEWRQQQPPAQIGPLTALGLNVPPDPGSPLSLEGATSSLSHAGQGHQLKINKATATDTASLLFQTDWSGRAEMGLNGQDSWSLKLSPDGTSWQTALAIDAGSGAASGLSVQADPTDTTAGRLMRADYGYGPGNLLGPVSETAGVPDGAVIEQGSNAAGSYVRFADGTQICHTTFDGIDIDNLIGALYRSTVFAVPYPVPFVTRPVASGCCRSTSSAWANVRTADTTDWGVALWAASPRTGETAELLAIGRWF